MKHSIIGGTVCPSWVSPCRHSIRIDLIPQEVPTPLVFVLSWELVAIPGGVIEVGSRTWGC